MDATAESEDTKMNKRRTSRREQKNKRLKRIQFIEHKTTLTPEETNAAQQGRAIVKHNQLAIRAPRLNFTYMLGGFAVPSGKRHRHIG